MDVVLKSNGTTLEMPAECRSCLLGPALRTAREAGLPEPDQMAVVRLTGEWMEEGGPAGRSTLRMGRRIADHIVESGRLGRDFDIYREPKALSNRLASTHLERLREAIQSSADPLAMAVRIAAAGNVIDFGAKDHAAMDIEAELRAVTSQPFQRFDIDDFRDRVSRAERILFVCDNAGEIVFDILLMETLLRLRPGLSLTAAFRDAPILNDATVDDARAVGIDRLAEVVSSGSRFAGSPLAECSPDFRTRFASADVVVSKGQGNLSSLMPDADERVFFVFRTKCAPVARRTGTSLGSLQLIQGNSFPPPV